MKRFLLLPFILFFASFLVLSGCYVMKQGVSLLHYTSEAEDIQELLRQDTLSDETRSFLKQVLDIKKFATEKLGLQDNKNYSRYVSIDKNYLVDVVTACEDDSFTPYTWQFPIVGTVPYKGFYQKQDAVRLEKRLQKKGYDVMVREVDAFSTLGFFKDPIYSFMKDYSDYYLANLIIHEQTHATIFLKNEIQFNEELATFIGNEGALLYLAERDGGSQETRQLIEALHSDQETFYSFIYALYTDLNTLYNEEIPRTEKLKKKESIIEAFKENIRKNHASYFLTDFFSSVPDREINNAYILSWILYTKELSIFYQLFEKDNKNFLEFISQLKAVEDWEGDPKDFIKSLL